MVEEAELHRAAVALKNSIATKALFDALKKNYTEMWMSSDPDDSEARDEAYLMIRAIADLQGQIDTMASAPDVVAFNRRLKGR